MQNIIFKTIGTFQVILATTLLFVFIFYAPHINGTLIIPDLLKGIVTCTLMFVSGIGILLFKKIMYLCSFYVYPILISRRIDYIYANISSEKVGNDLDALHTAIMMNSIFQILFAFFLFLVMMYLVRDKVLLKYGIVDRKIILKHIAAGFLVYLLFFRL